MDYEKIYELDVQRRAIGSEIQRVEQTIHDGKQAIKELSGQNPVDEEAISLQRSAVREAHAKRHELEWPLKRVKEATKLAIYTSPRNYRWR